MKADLMLLNANVLTLDASWTGAEEIAIRGDKILAVAKNNGLKGLRRKETEVIDCKKETVLPCFIEAHGHFHGLAESLVTFSLNPSPSVKSIFDIKREIQKFSLLSPQERSSSPSSIFGLRGRDRTWPSCCFS
jgi:predicted amidohydrolase YtcJ